MAYLKTFQYKPKWQICLRANLGEGCRGYAPSSPSDMTCGFLMQLVFAKCCMRVSRNKDWRRGRGKRIPPCCFSYSFSFRYPPNMNVWNMLDKEQPLFLKLRVYGAGGQLPITVKRSMLVSETRARSQSFPGAFNPERATSILGLCHGSFTDQVIFRHILGHFFRRK